MQIPDGDSDAVWNGPCVVFSWRPADENQWPLCSHLAGSCFMIMQTRLLRAAAAGLGLLLSASVVQPSQAADDIVFGFSVAM